jgi:hypothetical protein
VRSEDLSLGGRLWHELMPRSDPQQAHSTAQRPWAEQSTPTDSWDQAGSSPGPRSGPLVKGDGRMRPRPELPLDMSRPDVVIVL